MDLLEEVTEKVHDGYFVDLFVRVSNISAITMYKKVSCNSARSECCFESTALFSSAREVACWNALWQTSVFRLFIIPAPVQ